MQINGKWLLCDDGVVRPVIRGEILTNERFWQPAEFLVDTGADRTLFNAATLSKLGVQPIVVQDRLGGLGGLNATYRRPCQQPLTLHAVVDQTPAVELLQ